MTGLRAVPTPFSKTFSVISALALTAGAPRLAAGDDAVAPQKGSACALLTLADAQKIAKVPMKFSPRSRSAAKPDAVCGYEEAQNSRHVVLIQDEILTDQQWTIIKSGVSGKLESTGMSGIGDEAYFVRILEGKYTPPMLILFARKGTAHFAMRFTNLGTEPTGPMKTVAKKIAEQI